MAAPKGNEFWKLRAKHGRDKLFKTPDLLWSAAVEYFQWCEDNPLYDHQAMNSKNGIVLQKIPKIRAFTLTGLCLYLDCNENYLEQFEKALDPINKEIDVDFSCIVKRMRSIIYTQKFEGASAGLLNSSIIARDLGLVDKREETGGNFDFSKLKIEIVKGQKEDE